MEVVLVAMKPIAEKTTIEQAMKNGKGVTWLDDCRIQQMIRWWSICKKSNTRGRKDMWTSDKKKKPSTLNEVVKNINNQTEDSGSTIN